MPETNDTDTIDDTIISDAEPGGNDDIPTIEHATKDYAGEIKADDDERSFVATITTETVDRDGDVVLAKGLDFESFNKNPVVLLGHPMGMSGPGDLPIGRAKWVKAKGRKVIAEVVPAPTELGNEVFELIRGGFLSAVSIGFRAIDVGPPTTKELKSHPEWAEAKRIFRKSELVEFSVVNVPANPDALITAIRKGLVKLSDDTLKSFGVTIEPEPEVEPQPQSVIKRIVTFRKCPIIRPAPMIRHIPLTTEQIKDIAKRTTQSARGRMVPS